MSKINYFIIGGQYDRYNHGGAPTLLGAKRLAAQHEEHWDNHGGWHRPAIYRAEDCEMSSNFFGEQMLPKYGAEPVAVWDRDREKWEEV